ncbi:putative von Willebrand factor A domain-containing protein 5A, partial [Hypsibius exemplaris]
MMPNPDWHPICTLMQVFTNIRIPLTGVDYGVDIKSFAGHVTVNQTYKNTGYEDIEAVYKFPMNDQASIVGLTVYIDNRTIKSEFKKKAAAFATYTNALANNDGAYLLEQSDHNDDSFVMSVGRLPRGKECMVSISYVSTLESVTETKMRLTVPMALAPRYTPSRQGSSGTVGDIAAPGKFETSVTYSATLTGHVAAVAPIESISSPTHPVSAIMGGPKEASFKFSKTQEPLDRDLVIELEIKQNPQQHVEVEESSPGKYVAMLSFVPQFKASAQAKTEIIFVVDCSGSMDSEGKIEDARRALQIALRGIPKESYFNIFLFGSDFKSLFPASQLYTERTFADAKTFADGMSANMGGTEILEPLKAIFSTSKQEGFTRQVFVLTDGEVSNTDEVTALVRANAQNTRLFLFGLGRNSSRSFVNGIAATGNGRAEIIKDGQDLENVIG